MSILSRIQHLRAEMAHHNITAYLVPSSDPHQSEYVAPRWQTRTWLSGFTGSAGTLIVTAEDAGVWTDSRYFIQGEEQLAGSGISLERQQVPHAPEHVDWLADNLRSGQQLGFDGRVVSLSQARLLEQKLSPRGIQLNAKHDLVANFWADRPEMPSSEVFAFDPIYTGQSRAEKLANIRAWLAKVEVDAVLLVALDEIAWTLNIRAADVDFNPVCLSYLLVSKENAQWLVGEDRIDQKLSTALAQDGVEVEDYSKVELALHNFPASQQLAVDPATLSYRFYELLAGKDLKEVESPVVMMKAIKNETEIQHFRNVMCKDGVALLRLFRWLEKTLKTTTVTEVEISKQLADFRSQQRLYKGESFPAIVGYNGNGAIVHYHAEPATCASLNASGILLLDSGGQYLDGTTDITRTVALGNTTMEQRRHFTLVLKGMIALTKARFPKGTGGAQLDTLARQFLWQDGLDYGHGTGHGVGFFLNVHEGPQGFATSAVTSRGRTALQPGMVTSNEPGFYRTGHYGIRIENLILCVEDRSTDYGNFLRFETLTLFPIDRRLLQLDMLLEEEQQWLNDYHQQVLAGILPLLKEDEERAWLRQQCQPV
jgi:Xaa-Pro aminopeptidase